MKNLIYSVAENFNIKRDYKLYRLFQNIINVPFAKGALYEDTDIELIDRTVKVRVFNSFQDKSEHKLIIFVHGGGWVTGSIHSYTNICDKISKKTNCIVASIDYRLAPEYPFPSGFNDVYGVIKTIYNNIKEINISPKDIILMGDSAGGNLVSAVATKSLYTKDFKVSKQILFYPALQSDYSLNTKYKSVLSKGYDYLITRKQLEDFIDHYVRDKKDLLNPYVSPLYSKKIYGLPKTLIFACKKDALHDEACAYHKKLRSHLVSSRLIEYNIEHGFLTNLLESKVTEKSLIEINTFINT